METEHDSETEVGSDTTIWRYMDLPRFVSMLSTGGLWFAKAATFRDDPWEGFGKADRGPAPSLAGCPESVMPDGRKGKRISTVTFFQQLNHRSADDFENAREHLYVNS